MLELGSGCGLIGISLFELFSKKIILSDRKEQLPLLIDNIHHNLHDNCNVEKLKIIELDWNNDDKIEVIKRNELSDNFNSNNSLAMIDMIIACDVLYNQESISVLLKTIKCFSTIQKTIIFIVQKIRNHCINESALQDNIILFGLGCLEKVYEECEVVIWRLIRIE
eukprot:gene4138-5892_t